MRDTTRVIFTQGGKGGVAKTEVILSVIPWFREQDLNPTLLDFDIENTNKSGLQNFYPEALKLDIHKDGALDEFFDVCDAAEGLVVADLGAGAGEVTYDWFDEAYEDAEEEGIQFTSIGVTTNEAGAVQSVLKWAAHLQDRVEYLIVLNEFNTRKCPFDYWKNEPKTKEFEKAFSPKVMVMKARVQEFQAELRNHSATLQQVINDEVDTPFFRKARNRILARRYQRGMFDAAADILLPTKQDDECD